MVASLDGQQCFGLVPDRQASNTNACHLECCLDSFCEVWQFHPAEGCFRGRPHVCLRSDSPFARGALGSRLRQKLEYSDGAAWSSRHGGLGVVPKQAEWLGDQTTFNTFEPVEPYTNGPEVVRLEGSNGETFMVRRHGPGPLQLDVSVSCWSLTRTPDTCCRPVNPQSCWTAIEHRDRCCNLGSSEVMPSSAHKYYNVFVMISSDMPQGELQAWSDVVPGVDVDEATFAAKRRRWGVGHNTPSRSCANLHSRTSMSAEATAARWGVDAEEGDGGIGIRPLVRLLREVGIVLSRTFINIGAGTCMPPDPLYHLLQSSDGIGFIGLAVDMNAHDLWHCAHAMRSAPSTTVTVNTPVEPQTVAARLAPYLPRIFRGMNASLAAADGAAAPLPPLSALDVLVVDIDACDCLVTEELLYIVQPKILVLEIAFHIPPPFRFSLQHDPVKSTNWLHNYNVHEFQPVSGCSLSFALHRLRPHGMHLLHLTDQDAVFVHSSIALALGERLGVRFPQDEFACYRQSALWMQMPASRVREWFFAGHPLDSLGNIWTNLTRMSEAAGRADAPFSLDY